MKKLTTLLLATATLGLSAFAMNANANTDATNDNNTATTTTASVNNNNLKVVHPFLMQLSVGVGVALNPNPVDKYDEHGNASTFSGNLRLGSKVSETLNYDVSPVYYSASYFTAGLNVSTYSVSSSEVKVSDWDSIGLALGYQIEYSRTDYPSLQTVIMPVEFTFAYETLTVHSDIARFLHTSNFGDTFVTDYNESRGTLSYDFGAGVKLGPVLLMSKIGYNFSQSSFKIGGELGLAY